MINIPALVLARVSNGLIHITDWLPTFFGLAGGNPEHVVGADGYDVWNVIDMEDYSPRYAETHVYTNLYDSVANGQMSKIQVYSGGKT